VPFMRWDAEAWRASLSELSFLRTLHGGFMDTGSIACLDNRAFGISAAETAAMDPQQRLLLEHGYCALHSGRHTRAQLLGSLTGVFLGIAATEFGAILAKKEDMNVYAATGSSLSIASGRISFVLGLHGPCISFDTACSAALSACHSGVRALQLNESDLGLAAGVNLMLAPNTGASFAVAGMTPPVGAHTPLTLAPMASCVARPAVRSF